MSHSNFPFTQHKDIYDNQKTILPMAGLWSSWSLNDKEIILSYTIITKKADANISHIHNRMPLIIDSYHINNWLNNDSIIELNSNSELIRKDQLNFHKVNSFVNSYTNNDQTCIRPIN